MVTEIGKIASNVNKQSKYIMAVLFYFSSYISYHDLHQSPFQGLSQHRQFSFFPGNQFFFFNWKTRVMLFCNKDIIMIIIN